MLYEHNIATVEHLSPEPEGGYLPSAPVKITYLDGREASSWWGSDHNGGGVLAWRAEHGDDAAISYQAPPPIVKSVFDGAEFLTRISLQEYTTIIEAAKVSPELAYWLDVFRLRGEINVLSEDALTAKALLVQAQLLSQERADEVFATEEVNATV